MTPIFLPPNEELNPQLRGVIERINEDRQVRVITITRLRCWAPWHKRPIRRLKLECRYLKLRLRRLV